MKKYVINKAMACLMAGVMFMPTACSAPAPEESGKLINHMTEKELSESKETEFMLTDHPWEEYISKAESGFEEYENGIVYAKGFGAVVFGNPVFNALPPEGYDGGEGTTMFLHCDPATGELKSKELVFGSFDEFKTKLREEFDEDIAAGYPKVPADEEYDAIIRLYDAVISGKEKPAGQDELEKYMEYYYKNAGNNDTDSFYWQMDDAKVSLIKDSIHEYHLYDEELDIRFVVHVTVPPEYDSDREYPALVMTDAVWRFNDITSLYDAMASGKAEPQLLITIGFEYDIDSWDNEVRGNILCDHKKEFLDFITDNMMPFLDAKYSIDDGASTLFGHSQGGVFTHYAAFNYDRYENRPFKNYIIASPTFWTPYFTDVSDYSGYSKEYGYFERNNTYDRVLFIAAGDKEDEDYEEYYGDNDSTLKGVEHLKERLDGYGVETYEVKIYDSHHYQYVSDMLMEYVCR